MLFGCPKCRHVKTCRAHLDLDRLLMNHSDHIQDERCWMVYEALGVVCNNYMVEKRSKNNEQKN